MWAKTDLESLVDRLNDVGGKPCLHRLRKGASERAKGGRGGSIQARRQAEKKRLSVGGGNGLLKRARAQCRNMSRGDADQARNRAFRLEFEKSERRVNETALKVRSLRGPRTRAARRLTHQAPRAQEWEDYARMVRVRAPGAPPQPAGADAAAPPHPAGAIRPVPPPCEPLSPSPPRLPRDSRWMRPSSRRRGSGTCFRVTGAPIRGGTRS